MKYEQELNEFQQSLKESLLKGKVDEFNRVMNKRMEWLENLVCDDDTKEKVLRTIRMQIEEIQQVAIEQKEMLKQEINKNMDQKKQRDRYKMYE